MPEPMSSDNYDNISKTFKDATKVVAEKRMADAAKEVKGENEVIIKSVLATKIKERGETWGNKTVNQLKD